MTGVHDALSAADALALEGISAEVIDVRTFRPLDHDTIRESLVRTNRLLVVEEGARSGGWSAGVLGHLAEHALEYLDDVWRVTTPNAPIPYSPSLKDTFLPSAELIAATVRERLGVPSRSVGSAA